MYKLKRIGPKIEPCGTPVDNSKGVELYWSILTLCERDKRYELIRLIYFEEKLNA